VFRTVNVAVTVEAHNPSSTVCDIVTIPGVKVVTSPLPSTVATAVFVEVHELEDKYRMITIPEPPCPAVCSLLH
jgi:hypothetical protein